MSLSTQRSLINPKATKITAVIIPHVTLSNWHALSANKTIDIAPNPTDVSIKTRSETDALSDRVKVDISRPMQADKITKTVEIESDISDST
jgi:hypothetical protein